MPRRKLPARVRRSKRLALYVTPAEYQSIRKAAGPERTVSDYLREQLQPVVDGLKREE